VAVICGHGDELSFYCQLSNVAFVGRPCTVELVEGGFRSGQSFNRVCFIIKIGCSYYKTVVDVGSLETTGVLQFQAVFCALKIRGKGGNFTDEKASDICSSRLDWIKFASGMHDKIKICKLSFAKPVWFKAKGRPIVFEVPRSVLRYFVLLQFICCIL
jgi:hypothetical protein